MTKKICYRCRIAKDLSEFHRDNRAKNSHQSICKRCVKERDQEYPQVRKVERAKYLRKYQQVHKEEIAKQKSGYYQAHKDKRANQNREYRQTHKVEITKKKREYRQVHKEELAKEGQVYYQLQKVKINKRIRKYNRTPNGKMVSKRATHKRRLSTMNVEATLTAVQWAAILQMQNNRCNICGKPFTKVKRTSTMDHIIPLSQGGGLTFENVQALCKSCNSSKHAKLDLHFIQSWAHEAQIM